MVFQIEFVSGVGAKPVCSAGFAMLTTVKGFREATVNKINPTLPWSSLCCGVGIGGVENNDMIY